MASMGDHPNVRKWGQDEWKCFHCKKIWAENESPPSCDFLPTVSDKDTDTKEMFPKGKRGPA